MDGSDTEERLAERVVREAVGMGMDSPMRETILEAVDEAEGRRSPARKVPMAGALLGLGAAFGYLLGTRSEQLMGEQGVSVDQLEASEMLEEVAEEVGETTETMTETTETESSEGGSKARRLPRIALGVGLMAAGVALARRMRSSEEEEWEPIEEFESAVESDESDEGEASDEEMESESEDEESEESGTGTEGEDENEMEEEE